MEESGVIIPKDKCKFFTLNTVPHGKFQNYDAIFYYVLDGDVTYYPTSNAFNEPNETSDIRWIVYLIINNLNKLLFHKLRRIWLFGFSKQPLDNWAYNTTPISHVH